MAQQKKTERPVMEPEPIVIDGLKMNIEEETQAMSVPGSHELSAEDFRVIDIAITNEIVEGLRGHFQQELCYNIPRRSETGRVEWPECDRMPNGYCKYRKEGVKHIHIVGIGYQGAAEALQVMPGFTADVVEAPTTVQEMGQAFWRCKAECRDTRTGSSITRWAMKPYLVSRREGVVVDEFAYLVVQSLAVRNVILAMVPYALKSAWIEEYKLGAKAFSKPRGRRRQSGSKGKRDALPEKASPAGAKTGKPADKPEALSKAAKEQLESAAKQAGSKIKMDPEMLVDFAMDRGEFFTVAQATVLFVQASKDPLKEEELKTRFSHWLDAKAAAQAKAEEDAKDAQKKGSSRSAEQQDLC